MTRRGALEVGNALKGNKHRRGSDAVQQVSGRSRKPGEPQGRSGMQQARAPREEEAAEVGGNHEGGTRQTPAASGRRSNDSGGDIAASAGCGLPRSRRRRGVLWENPEGAARQTSRAVRDAPSRAKVIGWTGCDPDPEVATPKGRSRRQSEDDGPCAPRRGSKERHGAPPGKANDPELAVEEAPSTMRHG